MVDIRRSLELNRLIYCHSIFAKILSYDNSYNLHINYFINIVWMFKYINEHEYKRANVANTHAPTDHYF